MGLINIMSQQNKHIAKTPSLIASLYAAWEEYKIPAIFYHYFLAVLSKKEKKDQIGIMLSEIKLLKAGNHFYHTIIDAIQARERSLEIIKQNIHVLMQSESAADLNWTNAEPILQPNGYNLIYESRGVERKDNHTLLELINHIRLYQKLTYQVTVAINNWQTELVEFGYDGPIQFLYQHEDYLQRIENDTSEILENYSQLFENNPFLIFQRKHETGEFALVYKNLKFAPDFASKIEEALQIVSNHHAAIEHQRILGKYKQFGSRKKIIKSESLHKIYCNFNNNKDFLIIKDPYLKSDKMIVDPKNIFNFISNRNILINPEVNPSKYVEKRHPVYLQQQEKAKTEGVPMSRSSSLNDFQVRRIKHKEALIITTKFDPTQNHGKILHKKLSLYDQLDKTIKYQPQKRKPAKIEVSTPKEVETKIDTVPQDLVEQQSIESKVAFNYETNISPYEIIKYLRDSVFNQKEMSLKDIEAIARSIISEKEYVTLIKIKTGEFTAAWMAIKFLTKDLSIRKAVEILFSYKFFKIPNFEQLLIEQFMRKGYGIIREKGKIVNEMEINSKMSHQAIKIKYKVSSSIDESLIKETVKRNECLKESRLLKYYYYSKQSRYHRYCDHADSSCQIGYEFEEVFKVNIAGRAYLRMRCDSISKVGNYYRISHHLNTTDLLIGQSLQDILQFNNCSDIEFNSSFEQEAAKYEYLCLPETKIMHKYLNLTEKPILVEYLTISGQIPQILSITADKNSCKNILIFEKPFVISIICKNKQDFGKSLAILIFS